MGVIVGVGVGVKFWQTNTKSILIKAHPRVSVGVGVGGMQSLSTLQGR